MFCAGPRNAAEVLALHKKLILTLGSYFAPARRPNAISRSSSITCGCGWTSAFQRATARSRGVGSRGAAAGSLPCPEGHGRDKSAFSSTPFTTATGVGLAAPAGCWGMQVAPPSKRTGCFASACSRGSGVSLQPRTSPKTRSAATRVDPMPMPPS